MMSTAWRKARFDWVQNRLPRCRTRSLERMRAGCASWQFGRAGPPASLSSGVSGSGFAYGPDDPETKDSTLARWAKFASIVVVLAVAGGLLLALYGYSDLFTTNDPAR